MGSENLWLLGYPDQAARSAEEAVALAEKLGHAPSLTALATMAATAARRAREAVAPQAESTASELQKKAKELLK